MKRTDLLRALCSDERNINARTLEQVVCLAAEIAREGAGGHKVGTMLVVADSDEVLKRSTNLILDPLGCYPDQHKRLDDANLRGTVKELAQLDGAFVVSNDGIVLSACRYINASSEGISLPLGLGSRHMAAASITRQTRAIAIVASESAIVRVFDAGRIVAEIIPELWLLNYLDSALMSDYVRP
ncbi:MAG: diadenylate cyclase [Chloroflexota bacterium]|jgi:DNA integrity scanning protein DisA with diadenylate cyclase activity|nr:diadenylate cyclase [Chloroflexota bacterium]